jgi:quercetin dioxygenase-like cupin family protein
MMTERLRQNSIFMLALVAMVTTGSVQLSADQSHYGHINGAIPPGQPTSAYKIELLTRSPLGDGQDLLVFRTTRLPGTRAPIHFHDHGGVTCVIEGETTIRVEGKSPVRHVKDECFVMPPGAHMANFNSGPGLMVTHDIFVLKSGVPAAEAWRVVEPGFNPAEFGQAQ